MRISSIILFASNEPEQQKQIAHTSNLFLLDAVK